MFKKTYAYLGLLIGLGFGQGVFAPAVDFTQYTTKLTNAKNNSDLNSGKAEYKALLNTLKNVASTAAASVAANTAAASDASSTLITMRDFITGNRVSLVNVLNDKATWKLDDDLRSGLKALATIVNFGPAIDAVNNVLGRDEVRMVNAPVTKKVAAKMGRN